MIVLDDQDQSTKVYSSVASTARRVAEGIPRKSTSTTCSLPDYETSQAYQKPELDKTSTFLCIQRVDRKFWRAVLFALIIYIVISLIIGLPFLVIALRRQDDDANRQSQTWGAGDGDADDVPTVKTTVDLVDLVNSDGYKCNQWDTWDTIENQSLLSAKIQYGIPTDGTITLLSNYTHINTSARANFGSFTVDLNPNTTETEGILSLTTQYSDAHILEDTNVCIMKADGKSVLSIYIPDRLNKSDILTFNIVLLLPRLSTGLDIQELATYLPLIEQKFGNLGPNIYFDKVDIEGFFSKVTVGSLRGGAISVKVSMAEITGTFEVSESLTLDTIAAPINAEITLVNDLSRDTPTALHISTGNSYINAHVTLDVASPTDDLSFVTLVKTFNGPLTLNVTHAPSSPPAIYGLRALNNLGPTNVTVDSKYEGSFDVQTKFSSVLIDKGVHADESTNPYGNNMERQYQYDLSSPSRVVGWVGWRPRQLSATTRWRNRIPNEGFLMVLSSLSPVRLQLSQGVEDTSN